MNSRLANCDVKDTIVYMKTFVRENKILVVFLVLALGLFYWFQLRPTMIRKSCNEKALEAYRSVQYPFADSLRDSTYRECFLENGMKPESLYK